MLGDIRQAVEGIVLEGLGLRAEQGIGDGLDVANRVVAVGGVLDGRLVGGSRRREVEHTSAVHALGVVSLIGIFLSQSGTYSSCVTGSSTINRRPVYVSFTVRSNFRFSSTR